MTGSSRNRQRRGQAVEATNKMYKDRHPAEGRHTYDEDVLIVLNNGNSLLDRKRLSKEEVKLTNHAIERFIERMYSSQCSERIKVPSFLNKNAQGFTFRPWTGKRGQKTSEWGRIKIDKLQEILAYVLKHGTPHAGRWRYDQGRKTNVGKLATKLNSTCPSVRISKLYDLPNKEGDKRLDKRCITAVVEACYPKEFGNPRYGKITVLTVIDGHFCGVEQITRSFQQVGLNGASSGKKTRLALNSQLEFPSLGA